MTHDKNAQLLVPALLFCFYFCFTVTDTEFVTLLSFMICIHVNICGASTDMLDISNLIFTAVFFCHVKDYYLQWLGESLIHA